MELTRFRREYYFLILIPVGILLLLGSWWLYLVFKLASRLNELNHPLMDGNLIKMVKWEGATFIALLFILTIALFWIYVLDFKRSRSMQAFFASLTHELKSPLASINLQAQVLKDALESIGIPEDKRARLEKYMKRLEIESTRLEDQLDNHLQLSRIERDAPLNMRSIHLKSFLQNQIDRYDGQISSTIEVSPELSILGDDYAVQIIFRNLIENSLKHNPQTKPNIILIAQNFEGKIVISYNDNGAEFTGDLASLGTLFFKHNSPQGTGIGLYLIKQLMKKMDGAFRIESDPGLIFKLHFKSGVNS